MAETLEAIQDFVSGYEPLNYLVAIIFAYLGLYFMVLFASWAVFAYKSDDSNLRTDTIVKGNLVAALIIHTFVTAFLLVKGACTR